MSKLVRCVLANLAHDLPMPDRDFQLFTKSKKGRVVDVESPFYRALLADGSIVKLVDPKTSQADGIDAGRTKSKGANS